MNQHDEPTALRPPDTPGVVALQARPHPVARARTPDNTLTTPLPRQRLRGGHRVVDAFADVMTAPFPGGHLCGIPVAPPTTSGRPAPPSAPPDQRGVAWLLVVGGAIALLLSLVRAAENARMFDLVPACGPGVGALCESAAPSPFTPLVALLGVAGAAAVVAVGAVAVAGVRLSPLVGAGVLAVVAGGAILAHWALFETLYLADAGCGYCVAACLVAVPLFWYVAVKASLDDWLPLPRAARAGLRTLVEHHRWVLGAWYLVLVAAIVLAGDTGEEPVGSGALGAVVLICAATVLGAWLATRYADRMGLWLSLASAMMLATAITDILPDVWHDSEEAGTPLWGPGIALLAGFAVVAWFTRGGCGHGHDDGPDHQDAVTGHQPPPSGQAAGLDGIGAAAALTVHRVIEGATIALTPSVPVIGALLVHSASEGLALAALFSQSRRSMLPWLLIAVLGPVAGLTIATVAPLPETLVPVLLALVAGVLLRTALVGIGMARAKRRTGELRAWHIATAVAAASLLGALTIVSH